MLNIADEQQILVRCVDVIYRQFFLMLYTDSLDSFSEIKWIQWIQKQVIVTFRYIKEKKLYFIIYVNTYLFYCLRKFFSHSEDIDIVKHSTIKSQSHLEVLSVFCFLAIRFVRPPATGPRSLALMFC